MYVNKILTGGGGGNGITPEPKPKRLKIGIMETQVWISTMDSIREPLVVSMPGPLGFQSPTGVREPVSTQSREAELVAVSPIHSLRNEVQRHKMTLQDQTW